MTQKSMSFDEAAIVNVKINDYRIKLLVHD